MFALISKFLAPTRRQINIALKRTVQLDKQSNKSLCTLEFTQAQINSFEKRCLVSLAVI
jgi:hypothetical protein